MGSAAGDRPRPLRCDLASRQRFSNSRQASMSLSICADSVPVGDIELHPIRSSGNRIPKYNGKETSTDVAHAPRHRFGWHSPCLSRDDLCHARDIIGGAKPRHSRIPMTPLPQIQLPRRIASLNTSLETGRSPPGGIAALQFKCIRSTRWPACLRNRKRPCCEHRSISFPLGRDYRLRLADSTQFRENHVNCASKSGVPFFKGVSGRFGLQLV